MSAPAGKEKPSVVEAIAAVMGEVQSIGKDDKNTQQGYMFRGVDAVVNGVGPVFRKHGVIVVPIAATYADERYVTKSNAHMRGITMTVTFRFYGPAGDSIDAQVCGEASDSGDKAIPKAHSVAYRTLLLQALCIPTGEPDPDSQSHERAEARPKPAAASNGAASEKQLAQIEKLRTALLASHELAGEEVEALDRAQDRVRSGLSADQAERAITWLSEMAAKAGVEVQA